MGWPEHLIRQSAGRLLDTRLFFVAADKLTSFWHSDAAGHRAARDGVPKPCNVLIRLASLVLQCKPQAEGAIDFRTVGTSWLWFATRHPAGIC